MLELSGTLGAGSVDMRCGVCGSGQHTLPSQHASILAVIETPCRETRRHCPSALHATLRRDSEATRPGTLRDVISTGKGRVLLSLMLVVVVGGRVTDPNDRIPGFDCCCPKKVSYIIWGPATWKPCDPCHIESNSGAP